MRISRARGSSQGTRLIRTNVVLLGRAHFYCYVSRFTLHFRDRSANAAPNSEVHPGASLAAGEILAEALQMAENEDTRVHEDLMAAAIDPELTECPQHKRRKGLPVANAVPAGSTPALATDLSPSLRRRCRSPPAAQLLPPMRQPQRPAFPPLAPRLWPPCRSAVPFPGPTSAPSALPQTPFQTRDRPPPPAPPPPSAPPPSPPPAPSI